MRAMDTPRVLRHPTFAVVMRAPWRLLVLPGLAMPANKKSAAEIWLSVYREVNSGVLAAGLRELDELEKSVVAWKSCNTPMKAVKNGEEFSEKTKNVSSPWRSRSVVEENVVMVVKDSHDPLNNFWQSMLQMIFQNEIVGGSVLRQLLHQFLALNSPTHHEIILCAFA